MIAMVVTTSGRPKLAAAAVRALLRHDGDDLRVVVSDTSRDPGQAAWLERRCRRLGDARLTYLRAPELPMGEHWDWALGRAMELTDATHLGIHYDRMLFRDGGIRRLRDALDRHGARVLTYAKDGLAAVQGRAVVVILARHTDGDYAVASSDILRLASQGKVIPISHAWPILSNTLVHRDVLHAVRSRFGSYCAALGPDAAFGFRVSVVEAASVHVDRPVSFVRAPHRSAGLGYASGSDTDFTEFARRVSDRPWLDAVPLPGVNLGLNMLFHEYELVRRVEPSLPPTSREAYLEGLAFGLPFVRDPGRRAELAGVLRGHGWTGTDDAPDPTVISRPRFITRRRRQGLFGGRDALLRSLVAGRLVAPQALSGRFFTSEREATWWAWRLALPAEPELPATPELGRAVLDHRLG
jgi:hypothetical protein